MLDIAPLVGEASFPQQLEARVPESRRRPHAVGHLQVQPGKPAARQVVDQVACAQLNVPVDVVHALFSPVSWKWSWVLPSVVRPGLA